MSVLQAVVFSGKRRSPEAELIQPQQGKFSLSGILKLLQDLLPLLVKVLHILRRVLLLDPHGFISDSVFLVDPVQSGGAQFFTFEPVFEEGAPLFYCLPSPMLQCIWV